MARSSVGAAGAAGATFRAPSGRDKSEAGAQIDPVTLCQRLERAEETAGRVLKLATEVADRLGGGLVPLDTSGHGPSPVGGPITHRVWDVVNMLLKTENELLRALAELQT